jgi:hypothetical protein
MPDDGRDVVRCLNDFGLPIAPIAWVADSATPKVSDNSNACPNPFGLPTAPIASAADRATPKGSDNSKARVKPWYRRRSERSNPERVAIARDPFRVRDYVERSHQGFTLVCGVSDPFGVAGEPPENLDKNRPYGATVLC